MHSGDYYDDDHVNLYCMFLLCDASTFVYSLICRETDVRTIRCTNENAASVILHPYRHHGLHSLEKSPMEVSRGLFWARTYEGKRRVGKYDLTRFGHRDRPPHRGARWRNRSRCGCLFRCVLASLYEVVSVRRMVGRMVGRMVRNPFFLNAENESFSL